MKIKSLYLVNKQRFKSTITPYVLQTLAILLATFVLSLALSLLWVADKPFDTTFEKLKASHLLLLFDIEKHSEDELTQWFSNQKEVEFVGNSQPYTIITEPFLFKKNKLDVDIQITERTEKDISYDQLILFKGVKKNEPEIGEIWLPYHYEHNHGIALGDVLGIPANGGIYEVKVTAFVIDPHYLSNIFNPTRAWVAPGQLSFFLTTKDLKNRSIGIRLKQSEHLNTIYKRFIGVFDYSGIGLKFELFKSAYASFSKLLSLILLFLGVVILLITLLLIGTNIKTQMLSEIKQIGILKSLGFSKWNIIASYLFQSVVLLLAAVPIGLLLSNICLKLLMGSTLSQLGITNLSFNGSLIYATTAILISILVIIVSLVVSWKAGKMKPMIALRLPNIQSSNPIKKLRIAIEKGFPLTSWVSVHFIRTSFLASLVLAGSMLTTLFIILFSTTMYTSFDQLKENKSSWGFEESDFMLYRKSSVVLPLSHPELMEILKGHKKTAIEQIIPYHHISLNILNNESEKESVFGKVYSLDINNTGLKNLKGKHPVTKNEIALCIGTAKNLDKRVGDSVQVEIEGVKKTLMISGVYQDISAFGQGFRIQQQVVSSFNPLFEPSSYAIRAKTGIEPKKFQQQLLSELGETISIEEEITERASIMGLVSGLKTGFISISLLFIIPCLVLVSNDIVLQTKKNELVLSKLKTIGFTSLQLRAVIVQRVVILFSIALVIGLPICFLVVPFIANILATGIGIASFPLVISSYNVAIAICVLLLTIFPIGWFSSRKLQKIDPRKLVEV